MRALGSTTESPWTTESYAVVATVLSYLEPDPDVVWDDGRVETAIARLVRPGGRGPAAAHPLTGYSSHAIDAIMASMSS